VVALVLLCGWYFNRVREKNRICFVPFFFFSYHLPCFFLFLFLFFSRYTGWLCRGMVSATTYTLVGVVNKFLTVLLNVMVWDKHSTPFGILSVCMCLGAGSFYQQAPKREEKPKTVLPSSAQDVEQQKSLIRN
jgi:hypothetical protein